MTTLANAAIEGGYMINNSIEIVAAYQTQDTDGYATSWDRTSVGANWFINKHDTKVQLSYRMDSCVPWMAYFYCLKGFQSF